MPSVHASSASSYTHEPLSSLYLHALPSSSSPNISDYSCKDVQSQSLSNYQFLESPVATTRETYSSRTLRILDNPKSGICEGENSDRGTSDIILDEVELSINSLDSIDQPTQMNEPDLSGLLDTGTSDVCTVNSFSEVIETDTQLVASANIQEGSSTHTSSDIAEHQSEQLGCDELHSGFNEDSDNSVKHAEYVASSTSSTSSSWSGCSKCSNSEAENISPNLTQSTNIHSETGETKVKKKGS
ncbi:hypothetical protein RN001_011814 [Aquatica leii]|uniref:Uncharacterized protein n=1 Tax=Aquatica leii TaxID=1421715 RepID=A0AAN7PTG3_9COLE|nr:hypothetical protein RN001_011814 [Aquatica leii]